jgi:hypothetical protein
MSSSRRKIEIGRSCGLGKVQFPTWKAAKSAAERVDPGELRVYRGRCCGKWHMTGADKGEYSRTVAASQVDLRLRVERLEIPKPRDPRVRRNV